MYSQRIFRPMDPSDPYARYGKSPYSGPPFLYFGSTSYNYQISHAQYNNYLNSVDAGFTSWNNSGLVQFSRTTSGLTLTAQAQDYSSWGPAWSYPSWNGSTYELTPSSGSIVLNTSNTTWSNTEQHLNTSPHVLDVQTMVVHEAGHIMGLAHPLTNSYSHDSAAPTMAGGDNEYFDNTLDCRSLETEDVYGTQFLQLRVPSFYSTIQSAINVAEQIGVGYVFVASGTYSENLSMKSGVTVIGSGTNATTINGTVTFSDADNSSLRDVAVNGLMYVNSSSGVIIDNVKANNSNCYIDAYGSSVYVDDFVSEVSQTRGLYAHNNSSCYVDDSSFRNKYDGEHYEDTSYGDNFAVTFCQNQTYDIVAFNYASVDNTSCSFSSGTEGSTVYGDVNWSSWGYCGMGKISANRLKTLLIKTEDDDPGLDDYKNVMSFYKIVRGKIKNEIKEGKENAVQNHSIELKEVVDNLKNFIGKHNGSRYSPSVVGQIATIYGMLEEEEELLAYMTEITDNKSFENLRPFALNSIVTMYFKKGESKRGLDLSDQLLNEYPDHLLAMEWLYGKGIVYKYLLNDPSRAEGIFKEVIAKYPNHGTAISAMEQLGIKEEYKPKEQTIVATIQTDLTITNYPNPFNPETIIQFSLPEDGKFNLTVFNLLGQEIEILINGELNAGVHRVSFDASRLASGVYICKLVGNRVNVSKKMIVYK